MVSSAMEGTRKGQEQVIEALTFALRNGPITRITSFARLGVLSEPDWALFRRGEGAGKRSNGRQSLRVESGAGRRWPLLRDRLHSNVNERGPVPFALPEVRRQIWGGLP